MSGTLPAAACGQLAGRNRLQVPAAYPGEAQRPSCETEAFAVKWIRTESMAGRSEVGCSVLRP